MNFAFYTTGKSGRVSKFIQQAPQSVLDSIKIIISDAEIPDDSKRLYGQAGISHVQFDRKKFNHLTPRERNTLFSDFMLEALKQNQVDYCFSFGSHILCGDLLEEYKNRLINFHPAILPMFPGTKAIDQALVHGNVLLVGNTAHFIDAGIDTGSIIMQSVIPLHHFLSHGNDYNVVLDLQITMLNKLFDVINNKRLVINDGVVEIKDADYSQAHIYPCV